LDWTLGALPPVVDRLIVVVHYLADQVETYLRSQNRFSRWVTVHQAEPKGTGDALRGCREHVRSDRLLVLNGDDLYGAADLLALSRAPAGLLAHHVDEPRKFGIAFCRADGTLERLEEKPDRDGRMLANTGAYLFPAQVFDIPLSLSPRGEYEITEYVSVLASQRPFHVVPATFWLPIGTEAAWQDAQTLDLTSRLTANPATTEKPLV
jgi:dTDP-glucose pyrophosphorylase